MIFKSIFSTLGLLSILLPASAICHPASVEDYVQSSLVVVDSLNKNANSADSLLISPLDQDSLSNDSTSKSVLRISEDSIDAEIQYSARDSLIYDLENKKVFLYGEAKAAYKQIQLKADYIEYNWVTNTLTAEMNKDEEGNPIGYAEFTEGEDSYKAKKIAYNFKTKKGKAYQVMRGMNLEGEQVYVHSEAVKKNEYDEWYGYRGKFTTCNLEHPHYYIQSKKMKLVPDEVVVTGPANFVIADVPTPAYIPFGIFPIKKGQRSGVVIGKWGQDGRNNRGFGLTDWGYFFGINDYVNLKLTGDIYFNGTFVLNGVSQYKRRYKYNGNVSINYGRTRIGEPEAPDFRVKNDFRVIWSHSQTARSGLGNNFAANVNFGSSSFDRNFSEDRDRILNNSLASKINYSKSWRGRPFNLTINASHDQSLTTGQVNLSLPVIGFGVSRIQPFKSKVGTKRKWYESIGFSYRMDAKNVIKGVDSTFFKKETFKDAKYGVRHQLPISASFKLFKHFTLSPRINYTHRWYMQTIKKSWDPDTVYSVQEDSTIDTLYGQVLIDTLFGFKPAQDFNFGMSFATKLYGQINFKNKKIKAIRHVLTPSLNFNFRPDFSQPFWGNYKTVQTDAEGTMQRYSIYQIVSSVYGQPPSGWVSSVGVSLNNVLEMKTVSKKDTVDKERKIKLLESFNISGNYNFAADSLRMSTIRMSGRTSIYKNYVSINFGFTLDPYAVNENGRRINKTVFKEDGRLTRLTNASFSLQSSFRSRKKQEVHSTHGTEEEREMIEEERELFYDFKVPWNVNLNYNLSLSRGDANDPNKIVVSRNSFDFYFDANVTPKWKLSLSSGYDFKEMDFVYTSLSVIRDLHCWEMSFDFVPYPVEYQRYSIQINIRSSLLQDLRLTRKNDRVAEVF